jgi:hypothetical protein
VPSFRLRNKHPKGRPAAIRVGEANRPRSITLPGTGRIGVHDDTRRLRRILAKGRQRSCSPPSASTPGVVGVAEQRLAGATDARRWDGADQHPTCAGETSPNDAATDVRTARGVNRRRPRRAVPDTHQKLLDTL